nr:heat shock 70 kda protein 12a [Quercus suber]
MFPQEFLGRSIETKVDESMMNRLPFPLISVGVRTPLPQPVCTSARGLGSSNPVRLSKASCSIMAIASPTSDAHEMELEESEKTDRPASHAGLSNGGNVPASAGVSDEVQSHQQQQPDRLIVGVDFGTTYSGVAAVYSATPDDVDIIKTWPGGNGITSDKVPTEIAYEVIENPHDLDTATTTASEGAPSTRIQWGFQFKPEEPRLRCIKLFLDRNQKLPHFVSPLETAAQLRRCQRTVMDAVSDYLTKLYDHTLETLTRRYGSSFMATTNMEFVLTVPAVWSDAAKNATLQAAERAGMGNRHKLKLISEPEAAAVYTLKTIQPNGLTVGDNFIVCDAGGGTVDLIAYKVTHVSPLRVEESAVGTGGLCGSAFLNYRFEDHVKERIGEERYRSMRQKKAKTWMMGLRYFEEFVKRNFNEEEHSEVNVPFPGLPDDEEAGLDSGFLVMTAEQVKDIFEPVIRQVIELVEGQVDTIRSKGGVVTGIILVGGFGQSNYLYTRLKQHFNSAEPPPAYSERPTHKIADAPHQSVEVLQPMHAWTAVVRGAVIRGLEGSLVEKRRSRWHYGTSYATVFDEHKHPLADRYWSPLWERWMVSDRMQWHIAKGTSISSDQPISFHYTRNFRAGQSLVVEDELIGCEDDTAPDAHSKSLVTVCTLTTDLNAVPRSLFTRFTTTKGVEFDNLDFELQMKIESANMLFELRVDGVKYGSVQADFH